MDSTDHPYPTDRAEADLRTVNAFAISLLQQNTLEDLLWSMTESIGRLLGFEDCVIYLLEGDRLVQAAAYGALAPESREIVNPILLRLGEGIAGNVARTGEAEIVRDTREDKRYVADDFGGLSELTVPILFEGRVLGVIDTERSWVDGFNEADRDVLQSIANIASSRIASALAARERRKAEAALKRAHDELERRVGERTAELRRAVEELEQENAERRKVEEALAREKERLAVILRSIGEGIIAADRGGRILFLSDAAESLVGWPREEALGQPLRDVFQIWRDGKERVRDDPMTRVLSAAAGISEPASRRVLVRRDGSERLITGTGAPILSEEEGTVIGVVLVLRDVTHEQRVEEEAMKAQKLESLGILAGGIAHDFNNLLTTILGNVNLAQRYVPDEGLEAEVLAEAHEACLRARDLTKQLLTFASGGAPVKRTGSIVDLLRDSVRFALRGSNVRCEFSIADDLHPVDMDAGQINTVLNNLVINADQAMPEGGLIQVSARNQVLDPDATGGGGSAVLISIEDHGGGIPAEYLEKIFDPYFTTKGKDGTGLGLSTAYSIVREHGGTLTVDSEPGVGATFHLRLPASEKAIPLPPPIPLLIPSAAGGGRILLMDDEETVLASVTQMLQLLGYQVTVARDGEEAVRLFTEAHQASDPFKAVVLDLTIPGGMGGKEVIPHLQAVDPDVRAVVASGYCNDPVMADYLSYGFRGIIEKPFNIRELGQVVAEAVAAPAAAP